MPLEESFIGYLAGIFDGEGCVRIKNNNSTAGCLSIHIANTHKEVLLYCKEKTGLGFVYTSRKKKYTDKVCRVLYNWELNPKDAYSFLLLVRNYVIIKKKQVEQAINYRNQKEKYKYIRNRPDLHILLEIKENLKQLNGVTTMTKQLSTYERKMKDAKFRKAYKELINSGRPKDQAVAIALNNARKSKTKEKKKS